MQKLLVSLFFLFIYSSSFAQNASKAFYKATLFFQKKYVATHEVVAKEDKKYFRFFSPNSDYAIEANFIKSIDTTTVAVKTSGQKIPVKYFTRYGKLRFMLNDKMQELTVFQAKDFMANPQYKDYLFLPFLDATSSKETYGSGRYIDLLTTDLTSGTYLLDFNKAYNPYCAYTTGYNCPVPPKENRLTVAIKAGEMNFGKATYH